MPAKAPEHFAARTFGTCSRYARDLFNFAAACCWFALFWADQWAEAITDRNHNEHRNGL